MITSDTPYKLVEIIRDTWPNLYRPPNLNKTEYRRRDEGELAKSS